MWPVLFGRTFISVVQVDQRKFDEKTGLFYIALLDSLGRQHKALYRTSYAADEAWT